MKDQILRITPNWATVILALLLSVLSSAFTASNRMSETDMSVSELKQALQSEKELRMMKDAEHDQLLQDQKKWHEAEMRQFEAIKVSIAKIKR